MDQNKENVVEIEGMDHQGRGIAHLNGKVVFVSNALIGEEVKIKILKDKKNLIEAEVIEIIKKSKDRIESVCPYFGICGGCDLLHMSYQKQLEYKENKVKEIMKKFAGLEDVVKSIIPSGDALGYRNKVTFQVDKKIGFYEKRSNFVIDIDKCFLIDEEMNGILSILKEDRCYDSLKQVMIRKGKYTNDVMVVLNGKSHNIPFQKLEKYSVLVNEKVVNGKDYIIEQVGNYKFKISPQSFFQVNTKGMEKLYNLVLDSSDLKGNENILDLYCGTGTIGIFLSEKANKVLGIEISREAIKDANWNKEYNHIKNIEFLCGDTGTVLKSTNFKADVVIVDPPRAGLDENAVVELKKINALKIVYVSCDPVTLARDIKRLEKEYEVVSITPVDMFSNTYHVECVCVLNR